MFILLTITLSLTPSQTELGKLNNSLCRGIAAFIYENIPSVQQNAPGPVILITPYKFLSFSYQSSKGSGYGQEKPQAYPTGAIPWLALVSCYAIPLPLIAPIASAQCPANADCSSAAIFGSYLSFAIPLSATCTGQPPTCAVSYNYLQSKAMSSSKYAAWKLNQDGTWATTSAQDQSLGEGIYPSMSSQSQYTRDFRFPYLVEALNTNIIPQVVKFAQLDEAGVFDEIQGTILTTTRDHTLQSIDDLLYDTSLPYADIMAWYAEMKDYDFDSLLTNANSIGSIVGPIQTAVTNLNTQVQALQTNSYGANGNTVATLEDLIQNPQTGLQRQLTDALSSINTNTYNINTVDNRVTTLAGQVDTNTQNIGFIQAFMGLQNNIDFINTLQQTRDEVDNNYQELSDQIGGMGVTVASLAQELADVDLYNTLPAMNDRMDNLQDQIDLLPSFDNVNTAIAAAISSGTVDLSGYYTSTQVDTLLANLPTTDLTDYYTKEEVGVTITAAMDAARDEMNAWVPTLANQYLQYYYTKIEVNALLTNLAPPDLTGYYTKTQIDTLLGNLPTTDLTSYYTKTQVDTQLANLGTNVATYYYQKTYIDSTYYTKLQTYDRDGVLALFQNQMTSIEQMLTFYYTASQIDQMLAGIGSGGVDLSNYYTKSQVYTKADVYTKAESNARYQESGLYATSFQLQAVQNQVNALNGTTGSLTTAQRQFMIGLICMSRQPAVTHRFRVGAYGGQSVATSVTSTGYQLHMFAIDNTTGTQEYYDGGVWNGKTQATNVTTSDMAVNVVANNNADYYSQLELNVLSLKTWIDAMTAGVFNGIFSQNKSTNSSYLEWNARVQVELVVEGVDDGVQTFFHMIISETKLSRANFDASVLTAKNAKTYRGTVCKGTAMGAHVVMSATLPTFNLVQVQKLYLMIALTGSTSLTIKDVSRITVEFNLGFTGPSIQYLL